MNSMQDTGGIEDKYSCPRIMRKLIPFLREYNKKTNKNMRDLK
jgi:hypothetical protein